ncbi:phosphate/phosphite/phosphonate ABC transporter substrate-binding protein [Leucobacter allii]|uniref:Phosphate/phosphite/phosphonate ABC transporter substrate-binding protein n=1 Tax=Leucobacter allii TaxID=2932247 RepID=A0ABY4FL69_9MICO|nr:phosphate/phosphite/phosphonate ABC transporter substrate-binding protein [Leucobacter allii]UOQ57006.1 phosphate/phosphite/phosphonate ABC transporter substrate-binding protein [Leucobacter allii]UOR01478.1 phosphate/phosphite/phosphonate ABC transporter substrate-binding protein [Leucobacter allii]
MRQRASAALTPRITGALALGALALGALTGCATPASDAVTADDPNAPLTFAATPLGDDPTAVNPIEAFAELVAEETGREVEIVDVPDYTAVVEALRNHHVDIGFMSGFPSALAVNTGEVDALVAWPGDDETPVSTCLVLDGSELETLEDITPETVVAFADPASSSGYFMPVAMLHEAGLERDVDYTSMFSGGHDMSFIALKEGQVDVACTSTIMPTMTGTDMFPFAEGETRSLGESASMPVAVTVLADQGIAADKRELLLDALPQVFTEENAEALGAMFSAMQGSDPILEPDAAIFEPFVEIAAIADVDISDLG